MTPPLTASKLMQAQFYDIDPMNVVWHGNYARFFEEARCLLLDTLAYNYQEMQDSGYMWPVVEMRIKYIRPILLFQKFVVEATLVEYENRLKIEYRILDAETSEILTKAHTIQVAVNADTYKMDYESPEILVSKVRKVLG